MKHKIISIILLININFYFLAQDVHNFNVPDKIPENVAQFVDKRAHNIMNVSKSKKLTVSFLVDDNGVYKIEFLQNNELIYYDSKQGKALSTTNFKTAKVKSFGTQNIKLGWFRDLYNFGGAAEQPSHDIYIAESRYYWEFNIKQATWGYSSHHFEISPWSDCYGEYILTTQKVVLYKRIVIPHGIRLVQHEYSGYEPNYFGDYFLGTSIPVDNNATEYKIEFRIDFSPTYISGSNVTCQTQPLTFSLQNIPAPLNSINWTKSNNLTYISGQGTTNYKVSPTQLNSPAWVKVVLSTDCGNITLTKSFWVGKILPLDLRIKDRFTGMYKYQLCKSEANPVDAVHIAGNAYIDHWQWSVTGGYITYDNPYGDNSKATLRPISNYFTVKIKAHNACGWSQWADMGVSIINCGSGGWYMSVSPNPATSEATITLNNTSKEENFDETTQWDIEIYNQSYMLQEKKSKLRGNTIRINTSSWKEGIYYIKATYKSLIISEKLIIKR